jgi:hypothetical protein
MVRQRPQLRENYVENMAVTTVARRNVRPAGTRRVGQPAVGGRGDSNEPAPVRDKHMCDVWLFGMAVPVAIRRSAGSHSHCVAPGI